MVRSSVTVEQACGDWLAGRRLRRGTLANYANSLKPLRRAYGAVPLRQLTKRQINDLVTRLQGGEFVRADGRPGRPWTPPSVNLMLRVISMVLADAVAQGLIPRNLTEHVDGCRRRRPAGPPTRPRRSARWSTRPSSISTSRRGISRCAGCVAARSAAWRGAMSTGTRRPSPSARRGCRSTESSWTRPPRPRPANAPCHSRHNSWTS